METECRRVSVAVRNPDPSTVQARLLPEWHCVPISHFIVVGETDEVGLVNIMNAHREIRRERYNPPCSMRRSYRRRNPVEAERIANPYSSATIKLLLLDQALELPLWDTENVRVGCICDVRQLQR